METFYAKRGISLCGITIIPRIQTERRNNPLASRSAAYCFAAPRWIHARGFRDPSSKSRQMAGKVSVVSWSNVIGAFYREEPPFSRGCKVPIARGRILRTKWCSFPSLSRRSTKGRTLRRLAPATGRDIWLNNRTDELKRAMKCMTCVSRRGCITMRNVVETRDTGHLLLLWNAILPAFIGSV